MKAVDKQMKQISWKLKVFQLEPSTTLVSLSQLDNVRQINVQHN